MDKYASELKALSDDERAVWKSAYEEAYAQTGDEMKAYLAGWGAVNKMPFTVYTTKSMKGQVVGGWGMLFTDAERKDLDSEYFDTATETLLEYYQNAPLWMEHGQDPQYGKAPIGKRIDATVYPRGIWVEHELNEDHPLYQKTLEGIRAGELAYSSDAISHYVERSDDGGLANWFAAGWSLTKRPAEPALGAVAFKSFEKFITRASQQRTEHGAGEPAEATGKAASNLQPLFTMKDMKMSISDADLTALQTQLDESLGSVSMAFIERLREMNSDSADDMPEEDAMASADEVQKDVEELAKTATGLDTVKSANSIDEAFEIATNAIIEGAMERHFNRQAEKTARKSMVNSALAKSFVKFASQDTKPVNELKTVHDNTAAKNKARTTKPGQFIRDGEEQKHAFGAFVKSIADPTKSDSAKSMSYGGGRNGGFLMGTEVSNEIIPVLKDSLIFNELGVRQQSISGESYEYIKQTSRATTYPVGEGQTIPETQVGFDKIIAITRPYAARVLVPNKMLQESIINIEQYMRGELEEELKIKLEYDALFGLGANSGSGVGQPVRGLVNITGVTKTDISRKPTLADLSAAELRLANANINTSDTWGWAFSPRTKNTFVNQSDTTGQPLIRQSWTSGAETQLLGYEYRTTTNIPNNTIGSSDGESYIFLGDWKYATFVTSNQLEFLVNPFRYADQLTTEITCYMYCDFVVTRDEAFQVITGVAS
ncbi:phage major capsid protein [Candidatus Kaiserbacteria bacterium]|nr:phage major capsid protein [Candidatus Kaiserbacteria bacterium]